MLEFDQSLSWTALAARRSLCSDARPRRCLQTVIDHVRAEIDRDVDAVMATLIPEPRFHIWVGGRDIGPKGHEAVRDYYLRLFNGGGAVFESRKDRIVVDDDSIAHEGRMRTLVPGQLARSRGYSVPSPDGHYLVGLRNVVFWSFDSGALALGEDSYVTVDTDDWVLVAHDDLPDSYLDLLAELEVTPGGRT